MKIPSSVPKKRARIEIIPLIDIVFFLLATFAMVSLSMVKNQGVPVHLPTAATAAPQRASATITLTVKANGDLFFNKTAVTTDQLVPQLQRAKETDPEVKVVINGDKSTSFGDAVSVLDTVRRLGITKVAIRTQAP
jgi:biopolymer transport protein ExbD